MTGPTPLVVTRAAMNTRFEIALPGEDAVRLRSAAEEALDEIERLEAQLSLYRPTSAIARINAHAAERPVKVEPSLFALLRQAQRLSRETGGAFDITVAPLLHCWGFLGGAGQWPDPDAVQRARAQVGMEAVEFDDDASTVRFRRPGLMLDLGAIGKGYAVDRAVECLRDAGIASALLHAGTSSVYALGAPPDAPAWNVALDTPQLRERGFRPDAPGSGGADDPADAVLAVVALKDASLGVSAGWGKSFEHAGRVYGHVIDPRTGYPVQGAWLAAVILPSATETDALSTALLTLGAAGLEPGAAARPALRALVLEPDPQADSVSAHSRDLHVRLPRWVRTPDGQDAPATRGHRLDCRIK